MIMDVLIDIVKRRSKCKTEMRFLGATMGVFGDTTDLFLTLPKPPAEKVWGVYA